MERNEYVKERKIKDKTEEEKNRDLLICIMKTKEKLEESHKNFEFAESELIDYYSYTIKANQAKLDYLIKIAKSKGLEMNINTQRILKIAKEAG